MLVTCEICGKDDADVEEYYCCTGSVHKIECDCGGLPQYDGTASCPTCRELIEIAEEKGLVVGKLEGSRYTYYYESDLAD